MVKVGRAMRNLAGRSLAKLHELSGHKPPVVASLYQLPGCLNLDPSEGMKIRDLDTNFEEGFAGFKDELRTMVDTQQACTYFKFGDGDFHFLQRSEVGSARPGKRALSRSYSEIDHDAFVYGSTRCTHYMCELLPNNRRLFERVLPDVPISWWADYAYAAVASGWVTSQFPDSIGVIGSRSKVRIIRELMESPSYRQYLGSHGFKDYIEIPDRFACDDLDALTASTQEQLKSASSAIFLVGIGHAKSGLLWRLPDLYSAAYLDVGSGIDALAGVIDRFRPYFGGWLNFRLPEKSWYHGLDTLQTSDLGNVVGLKRPLS